MLDIALELSRRGRPVFPCGRNKAPLCPNGFHDATATEAIIRTWWHQWPTANIGYPMGNGLIAIDTDLDPALGKDGEAELSRLPPLPPTRTIRTPRGGRHRYYATPRNVIIKNSADKVARGIDIRGDGGYVLAGGTTEHGSYTVEDDREPVPLPAEWYAILAEKPKAAAPTPAPSATGAPAGLTPWEDYEARITWAEILTPHGWKQGHDKGDNTHWTRPGKEAGTSATTKGEDGPMYVFSGNADPLPPYEGLSKRAVYAHLNHGGDFSKAAKALAAQGYGRQALDVSMHRAPAAAPTAPAVEPMPAPEYWTLADLKAYEPDPSQYIAGDGWMRRPATTMMVGATGIGKSVLAVQIAAHLATGTDILDTIAVPKACRTIIVQAENDKDTCKRDLVSIANALGLDPDTLDANLRIYHAPGLTPPMLAAMLQQIHKDFPYEALILDNYQSYIGAVDMNSTEGFFAFRVAMEPTLRALNAGMLLVAHPPKPKTEDSRNQRHVREGVYNAAGTSAISNWVRASCDLGYVGQEDGRCILRFAKNAERTGAKGEDGFPLRELYLARSKPDCPYWRPAGDQGKPLKPTDAAILRALNLEPQATSERIATMAGVGESTVRKSAPWKNAKGTQKDL